MKYFTLIVGMIILSSCNSSQKFDYYQGYIYSTEHKPIENIELYDKYDSINVQGKTDKDGFFKIKENKINSSFLILKYENKIITSIQVAHRSRAGDFETYYIEGRSDTVFIDMDKRKKAYEGLDLKP